MVNKYIILWNVGQVQNCGGDKPNTPLLQARFPTTIYIYFIISEWVFLSWAFVLGRGFFVRRILYRSLQTDNTMNFKHKFSAHMINCYVTLYCFGLVFMRVSLVFLFHSWWIQNWIVSTIYFNNFACPNITLQYANII